MISTRRLLKRASNYLSQSFYSQQITQLTSNKYSIHSRTFQVKKITQNIAFNFASYPKHTLVLLPALSPTMTEGRIAAWHIKVGQKIVEGDNIFDVQTDKDSVPNVYQEDGGYVAKILVKEGEMIPTNAPVIVVVKKESDIPAFADYSAQSSLISNETHQEKATTPQVPSATQTVSSYPKFNPILLPALSPTMTEGRIASFHIKVGDKVQEGDNIFDVQTDKDAVPNIYQESTGFVAKIFIKEGEMIPTNHPVCIIVSKQEDIVKFENFTINDILDKQSATSNQAQSPQPTLSSSSHSSTSAVSSSDSRSRVVASPYAKTVANEKGVDLSTIKGSGPNGRIIAQDVQNVQVKSVSQQTVQTQDSKESVAVSKDKPQAQISAAQDTNYERLAITPMRRVIAQRLVQSKQTVPHFYLTVDVQMDDVLHLRKMLNEQSASKISVNDLIVKASALALRDMPGVNSQWHDDHIRQFKYADVAVAVSTSSGLITPIVFKAETLGLAQISAKTKELAEKARNNQLTASEYQGGTFTISNLGMFGVESFSAIVNPPHGAILAVGTTSQKVVPDNEPAAKYPFKTIQSMSATLSCDHRVVDGALGAQWLQKFKGYLEKPFTMLL